MEENLVGDRGKHHTHDEMFRFLAIVNDHLYQREWLLENAGEINQTVRSAVHQPPVYHYAVSTLINVIPIMLTQADFKVWGNHLLDSLVYAQELGDHDLIAKLLLAVARYNSMIGSPSAADRMANRAQEYISEENTDVHIEVYAALIEAYIMRPKEKFNPQILEEALSISEQSSDNTLKALIRQVLSVAYLHRQDFVNANLHVQVALELAEKMRDEAAIFRSALINASVQRHFLNWGAVENSLEKAWNLWETSLAAHKTQRNFLLLCYEQAAFHQVHTGNLNEAARFYQLGLDSVTGPTDTFEVGLCILGLTLTYVALKEYGKANDALQAAKPLWVKIDNKYMIAHTLYTEGYIRFKSGAANSAHTRELLESALSATLDIPDENARESLAHEIRDTLADLLSGVASAV